MSKKMNSVAAVDPTFYQAKRFEEPTDWDDEVVNQFAANRWHTARKFRRYISHRESLGEERVALLQQRI